MFENKNSTSSTFSQISALLAGLFFTSILIIFSQKGNYEKYIVTFYGNTTLLFDYLLSLTILTFFSFFIATISFAVGCKIKYASFFGYPSFYIGFFLCIIFIYTLIIFASPSILTIINTGIVIITALTIIFGIIFYAVSKLLSLTK